MTMFGVEHEVVGCAVMMARCGRPERTGVGERKGLAAPAAAVERDGLFDPVRGETIDVPDSMT